MRCGFDIGGTKTELALIDENDQFVFRERINSPNNYEDLLTGMHQLLDTATTKHNYHGPVGISMPGSISAKTGLIRNSNSQYLNGRNLQQDLSDNLQRPVKLTNDANCLALSEAMAGSGVGYHSVFAVIIGTGCGGGIIINQKLVSGINNIAGEWGHIPLPWPTHNEYVDHDCWCGLTGCLETFISGTALEKDYHRLSGNNASGKAILERSQAGDKHAEHALQNLEDRLARGLAMVINLLDPDAIILGGGLSNIERLYHNVPPKLLQYLFSDAIKTKLLPPRFGDSSGVRGAAYLHH